MRCNIFRPLTCNTGEFLTFSQYTEDLTKEVAEKDAYRVVPSHFMALEVDVNKLYDQTINKFLTVNDDPEAKPSIIINNKAYMNLNDIIPIILQCGYENAIATLHNMNEHRFDVTDDEVSRRMLWSVMEDAGFLTQEDIEGATVADTYHYWKEVKYIGDINFHSVREIDFHKYNEIYCHIPASAKRGLYRVNVNTGAEDTEYFVPTGTMKDGYISLCGWENTYPQDYVLPGYALPPDYQDPVHPGMYGLYDHDIDLLRGEETDVARDEQDAPNSFFKINCIIVFYDVYSGEGDSMQVLHRNRPMGIYFTGTVAALDDGTPEKFNNEITKFVTNDDAFGQGSAFGLRIMSRVVTTPNGTPMDMTVTEGGFGETEYDVIASALGKISDAIADSNRAFRTTEEMAQQYKDHLALFRNSRVNVPYVRDVNGEKHWFVNGRDTGQLALATVSTGALIDTEPMWKDIDTPDDSLIVLTPRREGAHGQPKYVNDEINWFYWKPTQWWVCRQEDINPNSATYGMIIKTTKLVDWEVEDFGIGEPRWEVVSGSEIYIEVTVNQPFAGTSYQMRNGYYSVTEQDNGHYSPTFGQTRTVEGKFDQNMVNKAFDTTLDEWVTVDQTAEWSPSYEDAVENNLVVDQVGSNGLKTGYVEWNQEDVNRWSPTLGKTRKATKQVGQPELPKFDVKAALNNADFGTLTIAVGDGEPQEVNVVNVEKGTTVTIFMVPLEGYRFIKFCKEGTTKNIATQRDGGWVYTFNVNSDASFIATMAEIEVPRYKLVTSFENCKLSINDAEQLTNGWAEYDAGTELTFKVEVTDPTNYKFEGWYVGPDQNKLTKVSDESTWSYVMDGSIYVMPKVVSITKAIYDMIIMRDSEGNFLGAKFYNRSTGVTVEDYEVADANIIILNTNNYGGPSEFQLSYTKFDISAHTTSKQAITFDGTYRDWGEDSETGKAIVQTLITLQDGIYQIKNLTNEQGRAEAAALGVDEVWPGDPVENVGEIENVG